MYIYNNPDKWILSPCIPVHNRDGEYNGEYNIHIRIDDSSIPHQGSLR